MKAAVNDLKHEVMALMERSEAQCKAAGDTQGAVEASISRRGIDGAISAIEDALAAGTDPTVVFKAVARAVGIQLAAMLIPLTMPGKTEAAVEVVIPAMADIARAFAATQDKRATDAEQGRLLS